MIGELLELLHTDWDIVPSMRDLSKLKDSGEYTEETEEQGNQIIKRVHYKSNDGTCTIYRESTTLKPTKTNEEQVGKKPTKKLKL